MATHINKKISQEKNFGLGDVAQGAVDTTRNVVGGTISGAGSLLDSGAGRAVGGVAGGAAALGAFGGLGAGVGAALGAGKSGLTGAALGGLAGTLLLPGLGTLGGAALGGALGGLPGAVSGAFKGVKTVGKLGYDLGSSATGATGEALKGIGNSIQTQYSIMDNRYKQKKFGALTGIADPLTIGTDIGVAACEGASDVLNSGAQSIMKDTQKGSGGMFGIQNKAAMANKKFSIMSKEFSLDDLKDDAAAAGNAVTGAAGGITGGIAGGIGGAVGGGILGKLNNKGPKIGGIGTGKGALIGSLVGTVAGSMIGKEKGSTVFSETSNEQNQRNYSVMKNGIGFVKDIGVLAKQNWKPMAKTAINWGGIAAGTGYVTDKLITRDAKKIGLMPENPNVSQPSQQRQYGVGSVLGRVGNYVKNNKMAVGLGVVSGVTPAIGYLGQRKAYLNATREPQQTAVPISPVDQQKQFGNIGNFIRTGAQKGLGFIKGMVYNPEGAAEYTKQVVNIGKNSKNPYTKAVGNFMTNHKVITGTAVGLGGWEAMGVLGGAGDKITRKALGAVDKNAYQYQNLQNQQIQQ